MKNNIHKKEYVITKAEYDKLTEAYNKCQEDIINRKYTKEEVISIVNKSRETGLTAEYLILQLDNRD
jgi:hypothetical protein